MKIKFNISLFILFISISRLFCMDGKISEETFISCCTVKNAKMRWYELSALRDDMIKRNSKYNDSNPRDNYFSICRSGNSDKLFNMITEGEFKDFNIVDQNNISSLVWAVLSENLATVKQLVPFLDKNFINHQDNYGKTALHYAVQQNNEDMVGYLVSLSNIKSISDSSNRYPIDYAENENIKKMLTLRFDEKLNMNDKKKKKNLGMNIVKKLFYMKQ